MKLSRATLAAVPLLLGGCANILHSSAPALQLYVLQGPPPAAAQGAPGPAPSLRIARPLPGPGLNTDRIALIRSGGRLDYYAGSRWSGPLPDLLAALQLSQFHADASWSAVADDRSSFNADYLLQTSIGHFAADYDSENGAPRVRIELHCLLLRRGDGGLLGSFAVSETQQAQENRMQSVVAAFTQAADRATRTVLDRTDQLIRSAKSPTAP